MPDIKTGLHMHTKGLGSPYMYTCAHSKIRKKEREGKRDGGGRKKGRKKERKGKKYHNQTA